MQVATGVQTLVVVAVVCVCVCVCVCARARTENRMHECMHAHLLEYKHACIQA